jgi:hypothetical protein
VVLWVISTVWQTFVTNFCSCTWMCYTVVYRRLILWKSKKNVWTLGQALQQRLHHSHCLIQQSLGFRKTGPGAYKLIGVFFVNGNSAWCSQAVSHPSQYWPCSKLLNSGDVTGTGVAILAWPWMCVYTYACKNLYKCCKNLEDGFLVIHFHLNQQSLDQWINFKNSFLVND